MMYLIDILLDEPSEIVVRNAALQFPRMYELFMVVRKLIADILDHVVLILGCLELHLDGLLVVPLVDENVGTSRGGLALRPKLTRFLAILATVTISCNLPGIVILDVGVIVLQPLLFVIVNE